jgi:hypothetical protein
MLTATAKLPMTAQIQQHSPIGALQFLTVKLQQLTNLLTLPQSDTSHLITEVEAALVSLQVEQLHQQAIASKVWDFFPTPYPMIEQMLSLAQIKPGMKALEPSAGLGHICREVRKLGVEPDCFEISPLLRQGLLLQGFNIIGDDFLSITPMPIYDLVLANPPFSRNGVARHTLHALDWLRPGGRLVTVAHHYHLKPSATDRAFFRWLRGFDACFYDCGRAFELGDHPCSIPIQLIVLNKPSW